MNRTHLLQHFDMVSETPDAVAKLRNFILHMATRGVLVPQNSKDEPAAVLAERVIAAGKRIATEQKLKLPTPEVAISEPDKSFSLPAGWAWVKLGDLCLKLGAGSTPLGGRRVYQPSGIKFLRSQNVWNTGLRLDGVAMIAPAVHKQMEATCVEPGDVLLNITGASIGRSAIVPDDFDEANVSQHVAIVRLTDKVLRQFIHLIIVAPYFQSKIMQVQVGVSREGLSMKNLKEFVIALPPLAEQRRIVAKVEELLALCDELEARQTAAREHRTLLVRSALDHLTTAQTEPEFRRHAAFFLQHSDLVLDSVSDLRKVILSLAVQGRVVPQNPKDESAAILLAQIAGAKAKADEARKKTVQKGEASIHEQPYILPHSWQWARFDAVATIESNLVPPAEFPDHPHVAPDNIEKATGKLLDYRTVQEDEVKSSNHRFFPGQIIYSKIRPNLSKATIVDFEGLCSADMYPVVSHINSRYLLTYILSSVFLGMAVRNDTRVAMPKINQEELNQVLVAVPPLAEEQRIVVKVDELMRWCDALEARLAAAQAAATSLLDATLHEILTK